MPQPQGTQRIVSLSPAVCDLMRTLGLDDSLVGRSAYDAWSDPSLPSCGELGKIDYEALLSTRPTHIYIQESRTPDRLEELARTNQWIVRNLKLLTLDEVRGSLRDIAALSSQQPGVNESLAWIEREMDRAWSPRAGSDFARAGRVLLLASVDPPSALGPGSFHQQVLERMGGVSAMTDGPPYATLDAEDILRLAPDAIVLVLPREPGESRREGAGSVDVLRARLGVIGRLEIPAVRNGRLALLDDPKSHLPSTALISLADELAEILTAWSREPK